MRTQGGTKLHSEKRKAKSGIDSLRLRSARTAFRLGVTLIELLITITIISILSATFLGVSNLAMESAREARTKSTIGKIHGLLMEKWAEYATRRVDFDQGAVAMAGGSQRDQGMALADVRLLAVRELMKLEMPDRWSDVALNSIPDSNPKSVAVGATTVLTALPAITGTYRRKLNGLRDTVNGAPLNGQTVRENQGAECLYMIVMLTTGDGEARSLFSEQDIGDTDGDGAPEFLDGWGRAIEFVRWPAGFISDFQPVDPVTALRLPDQDHDPADVFRRDQVSVTIPPISAYPGSVQPAMQEIRNRHTTFMLSAYRLVPLIYSRGPDGEADVVVDAEEVLRLDPYARSSVSNEQIATVFDTNNDGDNNSLDNIHNHLQDNR